MSALSYLERAERLIDQEKFGQAHRLLDRAQSAPADPFLKAEILSKHASVFRALGRFPEAVSSYLSAYSLYRKLRVPTEQISTLIGASSSLRVLGQYSEATRLWGRVEGTSFYRSMSSRFPDVELERALVARGLGQFDDTRRRIERALRELSRRSGEASNAERQHAYWIAGGLERFTGHFLKALSYFKQAVDLAHHLKDNSSEAFALCGLAGVQRVIGDGKASLANYRIAYRMLKNRGDPFGEAYGLCGQANAFRTFGDATKALPLYRRSVSLYQRLGDESSEGFAHWGAGGSYRRLKKYAESAKSYQRALSLFTKSKDDRGIVMAHLGLARISEDGGQTKEAISEIARGLAVARNSKLRYETALARYEKGRLQSPGRPPHSVLKGMGLTPAVLTRWRDIP